MDLGVSVAPWPGAIRPHSTPGLSTCVDERRLCSDGVPVPVSLLETEALRLAEWAFARHQPLVLCPADPLVPLPALIAAAVHVADMAEHHKTTGQYAGSSRKVAVITNDFHLRGTYRGLGIRNPVSRSIATLRDVVPAATVGRDGVIRVLASDPRNGWSTIFAPSIEAVSSMRDIDLVVVVPPAAGVRDALALGIPTVIVASDPADPNLAAISETATFCWNRADLVRADAAGSLTARLARRLAGGTTEVVVVPAHAVCENAALFWQDIGPLTRASASSTVARELAREAFALFHDLSGLALPLADYERFTEPLRVRLEAIGAAVRWTRGEVRELYLPMVAAELRDLAAALGPVPPKRQALVRALAEALDRRADVLLVARTAELARLHRADLDQQGELSKVRVTSLGALASVEPADVAVLTGMAPAWARWVYRAGIATELKILAYTPEGSVESVARGYDEANIVGRVIGLQRAHEEWLARPAARDRSWSSLTGESRRLDDDSERPPVVSADPINMRTSPTSPDVPPGLWDGDGWFAELGHSRPDDERAARAISEKPVASVVSAIRVVFEGGRWALLDTAGTVTRISLASSTAQPATPVLTLAPGDRVVFFDGDGRKDLLGKVIEVAGEIPALAVSAAWAGYWRRSLAEAYRRFGTYAALSDALAFEGCTVQAQTVRLWVVGVTIGPEDDEDVRRLGVVMGDNTLREKYHEVCRAFRTLRGAHIRLSRRLTDIAVHVGAGIAGGLVDEDEVVDQRTGLTVADFRESLDVLTVDQVHSVGDVPYVLVGQLHDEAEIAEEHVNA